MEASWKREGIGLENGEAESIPVSERIRPPTCHRMRIEARAQLMSGGGNLHDPEIKTVSECWK
jgi:hypothetical protein